MQHPNNLNLLQGTFDDAPPGASPVRATLNRGTGWYCTACTKFIEPIWIRKGKTIYPTCKECFEDVTSFEKIPILEPSRKVAGLLGAGNAEV